MARNGSGTYNRAVSPYTAGTTITAATVNSEMDDIATALTGSMARDGQSPPTANIPMGGFRLTGLGNAVASTDAAPLGQVVAKAGDTMTGALGFAVGTAALPGMFPVGDTNTGLFQPFADTLSVSVGGTEVARYGTGGFMRLADGTAAAPAYSFTGDPDTGIFNLGPNVISVAVNGGRVLTISEGTATVDMNVAGDVSLFLRNNSASGAVTRGAVIGILNESSVPVADMTAIIQSDGGSQVLIGATPAGSRGLDRRVNRVTIPGSGQIEMVGPVNVTSGGQTVTGDLEASGNLRFNSGYGSAAIAYGVRAWVNFNGTGTVAIRASGGVTSITDNGTGDYTVNFNFTMPDANYGPQLTASKNKGSGDTVIAGYVSNDTPPSTTGFRFYVTAANFASSVMEDPVYMNVLVVR